MKRARRVLMVLAASLLLLGIPGGFPASGQEEGSSDLFGYTMTAYGTAISTLYDQPSFAIPSTPTFEIRKVHSAAVLDSGPSGRGLGTPLWLGDVASNGKPSLLLDVLLFNPTQLDKVNEMCLPGVPAPKEDSPLAVFTCGDDADRAALGLQALKTFGSTNTESFPAYPVRSESFYPPGEVDEGSLIMRSRVSDKEAYGYATSGRSGVPTVISVGGLESVSSSRVFKSEAISEIQSRVSDLDLFGIIHVDNILTVAKTVSDGVTGRSEGTLEISGLTITNPQNGSKTRLVYDRTGLHAGSQKEGEKPEEVVRQDPLGKEAKKLLDGLAKRGISISVGGVLDPTIEGASATQAVSGLIVGLKSGQCDQGPGEPSDQKCGMERLMDALHPKVASQLQNPAGGVLNPLFADKGLLSPTVAGYLSTFFAADQTLTFVFGNGVAQAAASPPLPIIDVPPLVPDVPLGPIAPPVDLGGLGGGFVPPTGGNGVGGVPTFFNPTPVGVLGIPAGLLGLILFVGLAGAAGLRRVADIMTTTRAVGTRCSLEEP